MQLQNRVALITGAGDGIGAACAAEFARRGARLSIVDLKRPQIRIDSEFLFTCGDITDAAVRRFALERTLNHYGTIDLLLNNAGVGLYAPARTASADLSRRVFDVNVFSALGMAQLVIPILVAKRDGIIVNIGSIGGEVSLPWATMYCASKYALHCVSQSLRRELKPLGIRVITVIPGVVDTGFRAHVLGGAPPPAVAALGGMNPADLASMIRRKIEGRGSVLVKPWYGRIFSLVDRLAPWITDVYINQYIRSSRTLSSVAERASERSR